MTRTIDLNADVGEGVGDDAALIPLVTSANIACGAHAGDEATMEAAVRAAVEAGVVIGAHPGHADREHFGRRELPIVAEDCRDLIIEQASRLQTIAERHDESIRYVKLHGALYHQTNSDRVLADATVQAVLDLGLRIAILGRNGSQLHAAARDRGVPFFREAFPDRRYLSDGTLARRGAAKATIESAEAVAKRAVALAIDGSIDELTGIRCDSLCLHGDQRNAAVSARAVRGALEAAGVSLRSFTVDQK